MRISLPAALMIVHGLCAHAAAQEITPEARLISRIREHLREEMSHLPNYTCLQTITRFRKPGANHELAPFDQVRLEVVYDERKEWYGAPGDRNFTLDNPVGFIGGGMIGTGAFGVQLYNIFLSNGAVITYHGAEQTEGSRILQYEFRVSALQDEMVVSVLGGKGKVGEAGSFWIDEKTLDLLRVESHVIDVPPYLPLDSLQTRAVYGRVQIGEHDVLLPQMAELYLAEPPGIESFNRSDFTHCRAFHVNSSNSFGAGDAEAATPAAAPKVLTAAHDEGESVPALLKVTVELTTPLTEKDTVGTLIKGRIVGNVLRKSKLVVADGAEVRGRVRRLEKGPWGDLYIVGLEFLDVQADGKSLRFYADLLSADGGPGIRSALKESVTIPKPMNVTETTTMTVTLTELPGVASFFVAGPHFTLPAGLRTVWRTRALLR